MSFKKTSMIELLSEKNFKKLFLLELLLIVGVVVVVYIYPHQSNDNIELPEESGLIISAGSGKVALKKWYEEWVGLHNKDPYRSGRTSRNVFSAFCDSLESQADPLSGGAPQLVGLYRVGPANSFGIIHNNQRFLNGIEVKPSSSLNEIEWRNTLFERCCGETLKILKKAQRQPKLRGIKQP